MAEITTPEQFDEISRRLKAGDYRDRPDMERELLDAAQAWKSQITAAPPQVPGPAYRDSNVPMPDRIKDYGRELGRQTALGGRMLAQGAGMVAEPFTGPIRYGMNKAGMNVLPESQAIGNLLTEAGVPERVGRERVIGAVGDFGTSVVGGSAVGNIAARGLGVAPRAAGSPRGVGANPTSRPVPPRSNMSAIERESIKILDDAEIPLSRGQRSGSRLQQMVQSGTANHPATAQRNWDFMARQQRAFTRAVLKRIGVDASEATPEVMGPAINRLRNTFSSIAAKGGALYDDAFEDAITQIFADAGTTLKPSELKILTNNYDLLVRSVQGAANKIDGQVFNRVRTAMGNLSKREGFSELARRFDDALLDSLQRANPTSAKALEVAREQYRSMRIIEGAIEKGAGGMISPSRLANAWATKANRSASVYGQGGDQALIRLAKAAKDVVVDVLPDSGTVPRGLMQHPLQAVTTAGPYAGAQNYILNPRTIIPKAPGANVPARVGATGAVANYLIGDR